MRFYLLTFLSLMFFCEPIVVLTVGYHAVQWEAPGRVIRFESTLVVPPNAVIEQGQEPFVAIWPGLQTSVADDPVVFQAVVGSNTGLWFYQPEYCCDPNIYLAPQLDNLSPGDQLTSVFVLDTSNPTPSAQWVLTVTIVRGGTTIWEGSTTFDPTQYPSQPVYKFAMLEIEVQNGAKWNWGDTIWSNIIIEAEATGGSWCNPISQNNNNAAGGTSSISQIVWVQNGNIVTCCISSITMQEG